MKTLSNKKLLFLTLILISISLLTFVVGTSYAYVNDEYSILLEKDRDNTKDFIQHWLKTSYNNDGTQLEKITRLYNTDEQVNGYVVDFIKDGEPNGYIVLDKQSDNPIKEFALEGESITDRLELSTETNQNNLKIYNFFSEYFAKNKKSKNNLLIDIYNKVYDFINIKDKVMLANSQPIENLVFYPDDRIDMNRAKRLPNIMTFSPMTTSNFSQNNNCAPTALTNIVYWYQHAKKIDDSIAIGDVYDEIVSIMNFNGEGANDIQALEAIKKFAKNHGKTAVVDAYWFEYFSDYKRDINAEKTIFLSVVPWFQKGHAMVVSGYVEMPNNKKYLCVFDGWTKVVSRFIAFDKGNYSKFDGAAVSFS